MTIAALAVLAVYAVIALEAWNLSHPVRPRGAAPEGGSRDVGDLRVTPVDPLRLPPLPRIPAPRAASSA